MNGSVILGRIVYITVFCGCYCYLVRKLRFRYPRPLAVAVLAVILYVLYAPMDSTLVNTMLRYVWFAALFTLWSAVFLQVRRSYALYLAMFYTIFMGVWFSCIQMLFSVLRQPGSIWLTVATGICRIAAMILVERFFLQVDESRCPTLHEIMISLFPAAACFTSNLVLFDYRNSALAAMTADYRSLLNGLVVFFGLSALLVLLSAERYFQVNRDKEEGERARQQLHAQYQLFLQNQENNDRLKALHHDMKNHLHTLEIMSGSGDVQTYIQELEQSIRELEPPFFTGSPTLDALLTAKKLICDRRGIQLTSYIHLPGPDVLSPMELCTLFGNCIDNAIEAVSDLESGRRYIHLSGGEVNGSMVIRIENPYAHDLHPRNDTFDTTKGNRELHGYGLLNIRRIVEQKGGTVAFQTDGGVFIVTWMIPFHLD